MKIKNKGKFIIITIIIIICFILICFANVEKIKKYYGEQIKKLEGSPIDTTTGIINNDYFGINAYGDKAEETTKGINEAILYAKQNNIKNIKLETGTYKVIRL